MVQPVSVTAFSTLLTFISNLDGYCHQLDCDSFEVLNSKIYISDHPFPLSKFVLHDNLFIQIEFMYCFMQSVETD